MCTALAGEGYVFQDSAGSVPGSWSQSWSAWLWQRQGPSLRQKQQEKHVSVQDASEVTSKLRDNVQ